MNHHATLYIAANFSSGQLSEDLRVPGSDVEHIIVDAFGITESRRLFEQASVRPLAAATRSFVIVASSITTEAQNALLKLFEDPPATSEFHLVIPRESLLLPTLCSRLQRGELADTAARVSGTEFVDFTQCSYAERIALVADKIKKKDEHWISAMHAGLEQYCREVTVANSVKATELVFIDTNLRRRGGSKKMLLEALALALPLGSGA